MTPRGLFLLFSAALGAIFGSFANVCIHRLPRGESVVTPPSRCPDCGRRIAFYDNVPVLSWLLLRGRCRSCSAPIPVRYPLVEGAGLLLFLGCAAVWGPSIDALSGALLASACLILALTDLSHRVLPDEVTLGGLAVGLLLAAARDAGPGGRFSLSESRLVEALLGACLGGGFLLAVRAAYGRLRGGEGLGLGDVKMLAMIGSFTGPAGVLLALFLGSLAGSVAGGATFLGRRAAWWRCERALARGSLAAGDVARRRGVLAAPDGRVLAAGPGWLEIPGAAPEGSMLRESPLAARPLVAVLRLARRHGQKGRTLSFGRLAVDDGRDFFRVYAARAVPADEGTLLLLGRADIPFGVFLALGAGLAFALGRELIGRAGIPLPLPDRLLP